MGGKLHTGRSRNDQVATDMRLWLLGEVTEVEAGLKDLIRVMAERADKEKEILLPGYTHLQVRLGPCPEIRWTNVCVLYVSVGNLFGGPTFCFHMHSRSTQISNVLSSLFLVSLFFHLAVVHLLGIHSLLTASSSLKSLASNPSPRIACTASAIVTLSLSS